MELKSYITPLFRYWWLILGAVFVSSFTSFIVTRQIPPTYQAHTTLVVGRAVYEANPTSNDLWLSQQLASYYADIAQRNEVRTATMEKLGLTWLPGYVVRPLPNTQLLEIDVTDTSPIRAQVVANELANQLVQISPTSNTNVGQDHQNFVDEQISYLEGKIKETQADIDKAEKLMTDMKSARQIADAQTEIAALQTKLNQLQTNYASLLSNTQQGAINTLSIIENATIPISPVGPKKSLIILLSAGVSLVISSGAAYLLEYLDDTLKTPEDVTQVMGKPVFGEISYALGGKDSDGVYVANNPRLIVAEEFRALRVNLDFADVDQRVCSILITSASPSEGKTFVASNLAVILAQGGKNVILVDSDLRKPSIHSYFQIPNQIGLSDVLGGRLSVDEVLQPWRTEKLSVMTTGNPPPNPADVISSKKMNAIIDQLKQKADVVIMDGPPLIVPDSTVLSMKVDGVVMIVKHGFTRKKMAQKGVEQLNRVGARTIGVIINRSPVSRNSYYGHYSYYSYYGNFETDNNGLLSTIMQKLRLKGLNHQGRKEDSSLKKSTSAKVNQKVKEVDLP